MPTSHRILRVIAFTVTATLVLGWLYLYLDSVRERRKAENLIADLKPFPFATAEFPQVRQLTNRYGGTAVQSFPLPKFLPPGLPLRFRGHTDSEMPLPQVLTRPNCTPQDCTFEVRITPRIWTFDGRRDVRLSQFLNHALPYVGLRPWAVSTIFEVKNGKLWETHSGATQAGGETSDSYFGLGMLNYEVISKSQANAAESNRPDYEVSVPHRGVVSKNMTAYFTATADAKTGRAFDLDLRCFTVVTRACKGVSELAPTAWVDYQARKSSS
jgi:hypothetical protein